MNVLIVTPFFPSKNTPFAANFVAEQARVMHGLGVKVSVVTFMPYAPWPLPLLKSKWKRFALVPESYLWGGIPVTVFRHLTLPRNLTLDLSAKMMERILLSYVAKNRPDLLHVHFAYPTGLAAIRCGRQLAVPTILTVHGSDLHTVPEIAAKYRFGVTEALLYANKVLAVSDYMKLAALNLGSRQDILVHRIGINQRLFFPRNRIEARAAVPELSRIHGPVVLFVGNLLQAKGVLDLLEAFRDVKETGAHLVFVGDGPLAQVIARKSLFYGFQDQVHLLGARFNEEVPILLSASDIFVLPSHKEALGISCVEALACERPVIASDVGGIPEIIKNNHTGLLVKPGDPTALAVALRRLLSDSIFARGLARAGRHLVEQQYDLEKNTRILQQIYQREVGL